MARQRKKCSFTNNPLREDILELRNHELEINNRKLLEVSRLKNEFLANLSHDLRTPLNGIIGFAEMMYDEKLGTISEEHKDYLNEILSNANHLLLLINDMLDLSKIESGKMEFIPDEINLVSLIDEMRGVFNRMIIEKNITLTINVERKLKINLDPIRLKQVLHNLVSNAFKFTPPNGTVSICACYESKHTFRVAVKDTGIGIAPEDFKKLFIAFQQIETGLNKRYQGTGLGLALTRCIVEAQGGQVEVKSTVGEGSTFTVILPCITPKGMLGDVTLKAKSLFKKDPCILIIEEPSEEREELVQNLTQSGYLVNVADNIDASITSNKILLCDVIILDLFLNDISQWKKIQTFRSKKSAQEAPVLLVIGAINEDKFFGLKIHDFLIKPVNSEEMIKCIQWAGANPHMKKIVLTIDDDLDAVAFNHQVLAKFGYLSFHESDLEKALIFIEKTPPDVYIINPLIESKKMSGYDFIHQVRSTKSGHNTPIIITTLNTLNEKEKQRLNGEYRRKIVKNLVGVIKMQLPILKI